MVIRTAKTLLLLCVLTIVTLGLIIVSHDIKPIPKEITIDIPYNAHH